MTKFLKRGVVCTGAKFLNHGTSYIYIYMYVYLDWVKLYISNFTNSCNVAKLANG